MGKKPIDFFLKKKGFSPKQGYFDYLRKNQVSQADPTDP
jgi:hypothetical protein